MNAIHTYSLKNLPADKTDFHKLRKMTDTEINKAANSDPDARLLSKKELSHFQRIYPLKKPKSELRS